jgi:hypothetical protein
MGMGADYRKPGKEHLGKKQEDDHRSWNNGKREQSRKINGEQHNISVFQQAISFNIPVKYSEFH